MTIGEAWERRVLLDDPWGSFNQWINIFYAFSAALPGIFNGDSWDFFWYNNQFAIG